MPSSGIVDLAIGLVFVFGVTAALASAVTELIARLLGLRAAYLLSGLRELLDGGSIVTDLGEARQNYDDIRELVAGGPQPRGSARPRQRAACSGAPRASAPPERRPGRPRPPPGCRRPRRCSAGRSWAARGCRARPTTGP